MVIFVQCTHTQFKQFLFRLKSNTPALATITKIKTKDCQIEKYLDFSIAQSRSGEVATRVLPDASICDDCIDDITDKNNRRYGYPLLIALIVDPDFYYQKIPYDRKFTSMACFTML
ncbi:hypothetical protein BSPWISOXPB_5934 [uncultured Gammaproteobacteria bacterium]|nr:hypothetical protein BSPWISOXPB_5934 [uncultured Gammaproteobacteria bacterium]